MNPHGQPQEVSTFKYSRTNLLRSRRYKRLSNHPIVRETRTRGIKWYSLLIMRRQADIPDKTSF
ncbi:hypothetical protein NBRC116589_09480 [Ruegeria sp. HU-ET01832]